MSTAAEPQASYAPQPPLAWTVLASGRTRSRTEPSWSVRRVVLQLVGAALLALIVVGFLGVSVVRRIAEREAVNDASRLTDQVAAAVVMPALTDALLTGDRAAARRFDDVVRSRVLGAYFVRVKVWLPSGTIAYSDEPSLVGQTFPLGDEELAVLAEPATVADVSDLSKPENRLERGQGKMLEVYRPVWTPSGKIVLFETYARYDTVTARAVDLWRGFAGIVVSCLLFFAVLLAPLLWALLDRLRRAQGQREVLLQRAIDASEDERRRIAADLHDGVVQELVATSLVVAGAAEQLAAQSQSGASRSDSAFTEGGDRHQAQVAGLRAAARAVRGAVGGLRTLLVDIYPETLQSAGLAAALGDLGVGLRGRGVDVVVDVDPEAVEALGADDQRLVYRIAREALRNTAQHAKAHFASVRVVRDAGMIVLEVADDGVGLEPEAVAQAAVGGHLGLRLLADLAHERGAELALATGSGVGTRWRLRVDPQ